MAAPRAANRLARAAGAAVLTGAAGAVGIADSPHVVAFAPAALLAAVGIGIAAHAGRREGCGAAVAVAAAVCVLANLHVAPRIDAMVLCATALAVALELAVWAADLRLPLTADPAVTRARWSEVALVAVVAAPAAAVVGLIGDAGEGAAPVLLVAGALASAAALWGAARLSSAVLRGRPHGRTPHPGGPGGR